MPAPNIHQCIEAAIRAHWGTLHTMAHVLHFRSPGGTVIADDLTTVSELLSNWVTSQYATMLSSEITFDELFIKARDVDEGAEMSFPFEDVTGAVEEPVASLKDCMCVSLRTNLAGRNKHGKFYAFPPMAADLVSIQAFSVSYRSLLLAKLEQLRVDATAASVPWVVASGELGITTVIQNYGAKLTLGNQKRRAKPR